MPAVLPLADGCFDCGSVDAGFQNYAIGGCEFWTRFWSQYVIAVLCVTFLGKVNIAAYRALQMPHSPLLMRAHFSS